MTVNAKRTIFTIKKVARHAELVSASLRIVTQAIMANNKALKQVQGDS